LPPATRRVLCVDDDEDICELVTFMLSQRGYEVVSADTPEEALRLAGRGSFGLLILDYHLPRISGVEVCRELRSRGDRTPIIFFTGEAHDREREEALEAGAQAYLVKPADIGILAETAERLTAEPDAPPRQEV
jgi:OmpR-family two-component system manganese-sensing response regulator